MLIGYWIETSGTVNNHRFGQHHDFSVNTIQLYNYTCIYHNIYNLVKKVHNKIALCFGREKDT